MKRLSLASLIVLVLTAAGCVVVPARPRPVYVRPAAVVVAPPVVGVRVYP